MSDVMIDAKELGDLLNLHEKTILRLAREKRIPSVKITPRVVRFFRDDVIAALRGDTPNKGTKHSYTEEEDEDL